MQAVASERPKDQAVAGVAGGSILVLGDSLSAEYGLPRGSGWVALLRARLATQAPRYSVVNASISGETTSGGLGRIKGLLNRDRPALVLIELGGNDALRGLDLRSTESNLRQMVRLSRDAGAKVILLGMQVPPNSGQRYADWFAGMYPRIAGSEGATLLPFFLAGFADRADYFLPDRIHPTVAAQPLMLENVWSVLRPLL
ncbi:MAG: arylesterase [Quisquiliibacterium sp.]